MKPPKVQHLIREGAYQPQSQKSLLMRTVGRNLPYSTKFLHPTKEISFTDNPTSKNSMPVSLRNSKNVLNMLASQVPKAQAKKIWSISDRNYQDTMFLCPTSKITPPCPEDQQYIPKMISKLLNPTHLSGGGKLFPGDKHCDKRDGEDFLTTLLLLHVP